MNHTPCLCVLGRTGDIIQALPIAKFIHDTRGVKPFFMVSHQFDAVLQGVSYVQPKVYGSDYTELDHAVALAKQEFSDVMVGQLFSGDDSKVTTICSTYCHDSWLKMRHLAAWQKLPLVFDRRSAEREEKLLAQVRHTDKPMVLVNLGGVSSPYPYRAQLFADLCLRYQNTSELVFIENLKAQRVYDLLGLIEAATVMLTADTVTAHLAAATKTRYILLASDVQTNWRGSPAPMTQPKGCYNNCLLRLSYRESRIMREEIFDRIDWMIGRFHNMRTIWHVYHESVPTDVEQKTKYGQARRRWQKHYATNYRWKTLGILNEQLFRSPPMFKDLMEMAVMRSGEYDFIIISDHSAIPSIKVTYDSIRNAHQRNKSVIAKGESGNAFGCIPSWWRKNRHNIPDLPYGPEAFDAINKQFPYPAIGEFNRWVE